MSAYLIAQVHVHDAEQYRQYTARTPELVARHGGRFIVRGGAIDVLEGAPPPGRIVLIEFPSMARAREFYDSAAYQEARELRLGASTASFVLVEGAA